LRELEKKMNRFLKGRAAPWAWMQTGPLTVDVEARLSNNDREFPVAVAADPESSPECVHVPTEHTDVVERAEPQWPQRQGTALAVPQNTEPSGVSTPEANESESTKLTLDDFPALKAAMESFEKRGDPILLSIDPEPSVTEPVYTLAAEAAEGDLPERAPIRRRSNAKPRKSRSKRIVKRVNLRPRAPKRKRIPANVYTEAVSAERANLPRPLKTQAQIDLSHHKRRCTICHHPEREAIEEAFCQWRNVRFIDHEFNPGGGPTAIYRHARALNLFKQRNLTLRSSLEFVIEQSERIMPTAEGLVKAIRAYTRINDAGQWIDTPTTHIVQVVAMPATGGGNINNSPPGLTLNVRKYPSDIIESASPQPLLTGSAPQTEIVVTD
jgi:hypothetical protein